MKKLACLVIILIGLVFAYGCGSSSTTAPTFPTGVSNLKIYVSSRNTDGTWSLKSGVDIALKASNGAIVYSNTELVSKYASWHEIGMGTYKASCYKNGAGVLFDPYWQDVDVVVNGETSFTLDASNANMNR